MTSAALPVAPEEKKDRFRRRRTIVSWCLWDFGSNAFNTVMLSFVFSVYVIKAVAADEQRGQLVFANWQTAAGVVVAILAPAVGAWGDRVRHRRAVLAVFTLLTAACMFGSYWVRPEDQYLMLGAGLIAGSQVFQGIAEIFYNAMLPQISTPKTMGRISGAAWGLGYFGGVLCLIVAGIGFAEGGFGLPETDAFNMRAIALFCGAWLTLMSIPVMIWGPDAPPQAHREPLNVITAYVDVVHTLQRAGGKMVHFLLASAVFRDGLSAVFVFAGIIAASSYGFSSGEVMMFGLAANVIAALGTWLLGAVDDWLGPKRVIVWSLSAMVALGLLIVLVPMKAVFWAGGLGIASLVGAVQSSSRTFLTRMMKPEEAGEVFGLYATVGRAVSFIAPALVAWFTVAFGTRMGMMGIVLTLALGLAMMIPLRVPGVTHDRELGYLR